MHHDNRDAVVMAAFAADTLALGPHWIYDVAIIKDQFGRVTRPVKPPPDSFHPTKDKGMLTHYGDQTLVLLESLAGGADFSIEAFSARWRAMFDTYDGYRDHASRQTLENLSAGKAPADAGSDSSDLSAAARIGPVIWRYAPDEQACRRTARDQARMTHNHAQVVAAADYFAAVTCRALDGQAPETALKAVMADGDEFRELAPWLEKGLASVDQDTVKAIKGFGQMCGIEAAFPGTVHLIAKYGDDLATALIENVMAGGDSAARGMLAATVMAARAGMTAIPAEWIEDLAAAGRIRELLVR